MYFIFRSVQSLSRVQLLVNPRTAARQASPSITSSWGLPKLTSIELIMPSNHSSSVVPFSFCLQSFPVSGSLEMSQNAHQVAKTLEFQFQHQSYQKTLRTDLLEDGLLESPCSPRNSQESSPTPQFKSINSSALSLLHSLTLTSIHDHRKNHSLD